jgi:hypothetical protein
VSRRQDGGGFRRPQQAGGGTKRPGFFDTLFRPPAPGSSPMPRIRTSFSRGMVAAFASPGIVGLAVGLVPIVWLGALALGHQGPFAPFVNVMAVPPIGTSFDGNLATALFGSTKGLYAVFAFVLVRAVLMAALTGMVVDALQVGRATIWSAVRGLRVIPTTLAVNIASIGLLTITPLIASLLGAGIGFLLSIGAIVAGVYLFAFAPVIALTEHRGMPDSMSRSIRAARMPGAGNLRLALLYTFPALVLYSVPLPGDLVGVNPSLVAWLIVLSVNLLHAGMFSTFAFRYLAVADVVPDAPARARGRR